MKRIIKLPEVMEKTCLSRSSIFAFVKEGTFPKPVKLGGKRAIGWKEEVIDNWIDLITSESSE